MKFNLFGKKKEVVPFDKERYIKTFYEAAIKNGLIKEGLEEEWLNFLKSTLQREEDMRIVQEVFSGLFNLAITPMEYLENHVIDSEVRDNLIYFSLYGDELKKHLENNASKKTH